MKDLRTPDQQTRPSRIRIASLDVHWLAALTMSALVFAVGHGNLSAQLVPGTGIKLDTSGDDFEDEKWEFVHNFPKSSKEQDETLRYPRGYSKNQRWFESPKRGQPDEILRVPTPPGGLPGSEWALSLRTKNSGVPGRISNEMMQDDLIMNGRTMPVSYQPSCVVRVYVPPFEEWEQRNGSSFGIRADVHTTITEAGGSSKGKGLFGRIRSFGPTRKSEAYWPGFFIALASKNDPKYKTDRAYIMIRGNSLGHEIAGPVIEEPGWWTLGMSFTPDGRIHFYASEGVDDLTPADLITSQNPYGYRCESFTTMFFNVCNQDNGRNWSTKWIIDDPAIYYVGNGGLAHGSAPMRR